MGNENYSGTQNRKNRASKPLGPGSNPGTPAINLKGAEMYSKNWEEQVLYRLASEYLSKCTVCDECCAEYYCITNQLKTGRAPKDNCPDKIIEYLKAQYKKTH